MTLPLQGRGRWFKSAWPHRGPPSGARRVRTHRKGFEAGSEQGGTEDPAGSGAEPGDEASDRGSNPVAPVRTAERSRADSWIYHNCHRHPGMRIHVLIFDGFDELGAIGPYEVFRTASDPGADCGASPVTLTERDVVTAAKGLRVVRMAVLRQRGPPRRPSCWWCRAAGGTTTTGSAGRPTPATCRMRSAPTGTAAARWRRSALAQCCSNVPWCWGAGSR